MKVKFIIIINIIVIYVFTTEGRRTLVDIGHGLEVDNAEMTTDS